MYGTSVVKYQDIQLDADQIQMSLDSSTVYAMGRPDSLGEIIGSPIYKDASGEYESETMRYNFKSKKGFITNVITQQGEGYLTGGRTKRWRRMFSLWKMDVTLRATITSIHTSTCN